MKLNGPGQYDNLCTHVMNETDATMAVVIVLGGNKGKGFSVQSSDLNLIAALPELLESVAAEIRSLNIKQANPN